MSAKFGAAGLFSLLLLSATPDTNPDQARVIESMMNATAARFDKVLAYSRMQRYSAVDDRFGLKAEMLARVHYDHATGKTYEIISSSGSPLIQSRVFEALLREEVETSKLLTHEGGLLTTHNSFRLAGRDAFAGHRCYLVELNPRRRDKHLIVGRAWVDMEDYGFVHIEGRTADSLSLWIGKPLITQDFEMLSRFWFASRRHSVMNGFLIGPAELTVEYSDYQIRLKTETTAPPNH